MRYILLIILSLTILIRSNAQNDTCLHTTVLGISFPPVETDEQRSFSKTRLDDLGVKKIRFAEDWAQREPAPGEFYWQPLDARIKRSKPR